MGKLTINGPFSIAMLVYQRVIHDLLDGAQSVEKVGFSRTIRSGFQSSPAGPAKLWPFQWHGSGLRDWAKRRPKE